MIFNINIGDIVEPNMLSVSLYDKGILMQVLDIEPHPRYGGEYKVRVKILKDKHNLAKYTNEWGISHIQKVANADSKLSPDQIIDLISI